MKKIFALALFVFVIIGLCSINTVHGQNRDRVYNYGFDIRGNVKIQDTIFFAGDTILELGSGDAALDGNRAVTRSGLPAINAGGETVAEWIENYFFPATNPTASISVGGTTYEYMSAGADLSVNLNYTATRPVACPEITSITVDGIAQTVDNPFNEGHTQNGTVNNRPLPRNTQTTYTISVVAGTKSGSANTTVVWRWKRYWGAYASAVPPTDPGFTITDANILALTGAGVGSGNEFATSRVKTYNGINGAGNYLVFAFPSAWGTPTFVINGLTSNAFTKVRDNVFVNASGGSTTYQVWVSNTPQSSAIANFQIN